jgi:hypothetical protein
MQFYIVKNHNLQWHLNKQFSDQCFSNEQLYPYLIHKESLPTFYIQEISF